MVFGSLALAVKSEQDNYLVGNPQFTYFKGVYRRHTNFAIDYNTVRFVGETGDCWGKKIYLKLPKNADLIHKMFLRIEIEHGDQSNFDYTPFIYNFIEYIDLFIGDQLIDRHYAEWYNIWHNLFEDSDKSYLLSKMVKVDNSSSPGKTILSLPLRFWFNNEIGSALPIVAMQYNDVRLEIRFNEKSKVNKLSNQQTTTVDSALKICKVELLVENIYLDQEERRAFITKKHEYLITQVQSSLFNTIDKLSAKYNIPNYESTMHKVDIRLRYPVKELFWSIQDQESDGLHKKDGTVGSQYNNTGAFQFNYWNNYRPGHDQINTATFTLNGKDLMDALPGPFYRKIQQYQYHSGYGIRNCDINTSDISGSNNPKEDYLKFSKGNGIYSYSFSVYPEKNQPSGSLNFSKLENAQLKFSLLKGKKETTDSTDYKQKLVNIHGVNYNVLRIMGGSAGLAFVN